MLVYALIMARNLTLHSNMGHSPLISLPKCTHQISIPSFECQLKSSGYSFTKKFKPPFFRFPVTSNMQHCSRRIKHVAASLASAGVHTAAAVERQYSEIHPNVWDDYFIQSRRSSFLLPGYHEVAQTLAKVIKEDLAITFRECPTNSDVLTRLSVVDSLFCLGIDRYFKQEIAEALDFVSSCWKQVKGCLCTGSTSEKPDLNTTALGFRLLRLNRYHDISPDCFLRFETVDGGFFDSNRDGFEAVKTYLNLLRASCLQFPGEILLQRAESFAADFLKAWLVRTSSSAHAYPDFLANEVRYALKYPWHINPPRWEARNSIDFYQANEPWLMKQPMNWKILQLAKLDFNIVQAHHQQELKLLSGWWNNSKVSRWPFLRHRPVESYFSGAVGIFEPEFCDARLAIAKAGKMVYLLDDIYDRCAVPEEIPMVNSTMERFGLPAAGLIHDPIVEMLQFIMHTVSELGHDCSKKQKCNVEKYVRRRWQELSRSFAAEETWNCSGCVPSLEEYLKNGSESIGVWPLYLAGKLHMYDSFPLSILEHGASDFEKQCGKFCRLIDDIQDFAEERKLGEKVSAVECYIHQNPNCTRTEDALQPLKVMARELMRKVTMHYLWPTQEQEESQSMFDENCRRRVAFEVTRAFHFFYCDDADGLTCSNGSVMNQIRSLLFEEVPM